MAHTEKNVALEAITEILAENAECVDQAGDDYRCECPVGYPRVKVDINVSRNDLKNTMADLCNKTDGEWAPSE
jgi:hypothetical protein